MLTHKRLRQSDTTTLHPESKLNVLLIILDTRGVIVCQSRTPSRDFPELDAFADDATLFERAVATRMDGLSRFDVHRAVCQHAPGDAGGRPPVGSYPTLAEILQVAGYHTAFCNNRWSVLDHGLQRGFEHFYNRGSSPEPPV
jgi:arylsulfatase A-like enzyme